ncbi:hypothetical protein B0H10DRAFT_2139322 [Mycena sp. CBHHK59/15]|nr:hypothetical protein B0H10DRAFT_2139322 [Mycena sp. CBHHK59/15]
MNAVESLGWPESPHALDGTIERVKQVKSIGLDVGLSVLTSTAAPPPPPPPPPPSPPLYGMTGIPIALGERLFTRQDCCPYFESGCIDIIQPDVAHSGGISETKRIANMAEWCLLHPELRHLRDELEDALQRRRLLTCLRT